jgi:transposase
MRLNFPLLIRRRDVDLFGRVPAKTNAARPGAGLSTAPNKSNSVDALDPVLPLSPGRAELRGCEYDRHGTLSLDAALNTRTGEIIGHTVPRRTSDALFDFLTDIVGTQPWRREIRVMVDNLSAHKTQKVQAFLEAHPWVQLHFTPTYASWLNQVELWSAKIERDVLARGVFASLPDLARKIRRYITL